MSDETGEKVIDLPRTFSIEEAVRREKARQERPQPPPAETPPLPAPPRADGENPGGGPEEFDPDSTDYKAFGWAGNRALPSLVVILKDGSECGFNYADLASASPDGSMFFPSASGFKGNVIRLRIAGDDGVFLVVIEGLRLRRVWRLIMGHQTPWIFERPEGMEFVDPKEPVIRSIAFTPVKAARAAAGAGG